MRSRNTLKRTKQVSTMNQRISDVHLIDGLASVEASTWIHVHELKRLTYGVKYDYKVKTPSHELPGFQFRVPSPFQDEQKNTTIIYFADLDAGAFGEVSIASVEKRCELNNAERIDAVLHGGDLIYEIMDEDGQKAARYFNRIQKFASTVPYMVTAGNHENYDNFSSFRARFRTPHYAKSHTHYYSFDIGNVHFIMMNLDFYMENPSQQMAMIKWLEMDLAAATDEITHAETPWMVFVSHRPLYCSNKFPDCVDNFRNFSWLETILRDNNVDLYLTGHLHDYERFYPMYQNKSQPYTPKNEDKEVRYLINPSAPIHVMEGSPGNDVWFKVEPGPYKDYSVVKDFNMGYGILQSLNNTHLYYRHVNSSNGAVLDWFYIIKAGNREEFDPLPDNGLSTGALWIIVLITTSCVVGGLVFYSFKTRAAEQQGLSGGEEGYQEMKSTEIDLPSKSHGGRN
eukprot:TRINITY_DN4439_c0_g1_i1.p1 TRINITY_DN4439_c0_g1~~TRINITY_DN4439_c0_g1_i1.p1  ORF type:complete len:455 (-),score=77.51 TRINITY_DN4439_c0_g1_i1:221-1585(-)